MHFNFPLAVEPFYSSSNVVYASIAVHAVSKGRRTFFFLGIFLSSSMRGFMLYEMTKNNVSNFSIFLDN